MKTIELNIPKEKENEVIRDLCRHTGINWVYYRKNYLFRRLEYRMQKCGIGDYREYIRNLRGNRLEIKELTDSIGVNVTAFFRDREVFELLGNEVLPVMLSAKREAGGEGLHIWCAGCATGEEPYSMSMILNEMLGGETEGNKITATDIDEAALNFAKKGCYTSERLILVSDRLIEKYFTRPDEIIYEATERLKAPVKFKRHDVIGLPPVSMTDIILCRNMLIYIKPEYQLPLFDKFYASLARGGFLVIGKSESLPKEFYDKFAPFNQDERVYRKV